MSIVKKVLGYLLWFYDGVEVHDEFKSDITRLTKTHLFFTLIGFFYVSYFLEGVRQDKGFIYLFGVLFGTYIIMTLFYYLKIRFK